MATGGGEFGYNDPELDKNLTMMKMKRKRKRKRFTEPCLSNHVRHLPPTMAVNKFKWKLCSTSSLACLTLLMM